VTVNIERDSERAQRDAQVRLRWGPVPVDAAYALRWLSEILGPEDERVLRFQGLLRQTDV
jgi:hypothetical protein